MFGGWVLSTQVKDLRRHGKKLDEAHLERLVALLVLLLKDDNGQAGPPCNVPLGLLLASLPRH